MCTPAANALPALNLPFAPLRISERDGVRKVFDPYRRKYVKLTPEEHVRQTFLHYLTHHLHYPAGLTAVEHLVNVNGQNQRADIVVFDAACKPYLVVECKAPTVQLSQETFNQALRYNARLGCRYLVLTNGLQHFCAQIISSTEARFVRQIPACSP